MKKYSFEKSALPNDKVKHTEPKYLFVPSYEMNLNTNSLNNKRRSRSLKRVERVGEK